ncbi:hypothetical protein F5878DRAFT_666145 [Lentinula raphanica]|uniref:Uncharacterized protein n=1 Tax=Lentinula raphanica TaxID=153919 RepID=A0AA38NYI9_9AGAR|nr:hypothetical protein F5878DRAFT_666145 [Lentinula raphanica]
MARHPYLTTLGAVTVAAVPFATVGGLMTAPHGTKDKAELMADHDGMSGDGGSGGSGGGDGGDSGGVVGGDSSGGSSDSLGGGTSDGGSNGVTRLLKAAISVFPYRLEPVTLAEK